MIRLAGDIIVRIMVSLDGATPRIGVDYAGEWAKKPWRFVDPDSAFLSQKLR